MVLDMSDKGILPDWNAIRNQILTDFYKCNDLLDKYRLTSTTCSYNKMMKEHYWNQFVSILIRLFKISKTSLKKHPKLAEHYEQLEILNSHTDDMTGLDKVTVLHLFNLMEEALYLIGLLNISKQEDEEEDRAILG